MPGLSVPDREAKAAAVAAGLSHYTPTKACGQGHVSRRAISTGRCMACLAARARVWKAKRAEVVRPRDAEAHHRARAAKAVAEGRTPGRIGRIRHLTDEQRLERRRANSRNYFVARPGLKKAMDADYHARRPEMTIARVAKRRAIKKAAPGSFTAADVRALLAAQKGKCTLCLTPFGEERPHVDHYLPLALGGSNDRSNLRLLHPTCNLSKGARHPLDHGRSLGLLCW